MSKVRAVSSIGLDVRLLSLGGREGPGRQINGDYELVEVYKLYMDVSM